ncbi:MAG: sulfotransferase, partial [bacterium]|nr:sulfotransferase [bacterium]
LTCHPNIVVPPESGFLVNLYHEYREFSGKKEELHAFVQQVLKSDKMEEWRISAPGLSNYLEARNPSTYAQLVSGVYYYYGETQQPGKTRWGDKNNFFLGNIETIAAIYPDALFLHLVRDGRDVACSYRQLATVKGKHAPKLPNSVRKAAAHWQNNLLTIRQSFDKTGWQKVHELRYEELVTEPEETLKKVCHFIGEPYSPDMLRFDEMNRRHQLEPASFDDWKSRAKEELTASRVNRWQREMLAGDVALFELEARRMLTHYNYPLSPDAHSLKRKVLSFFYRLARFLVRVLKMTYLRRMYRKLTGN